MTIGRVAPALRLCRACRQFIWPDERTCTHCQSDLAQADHDYLTALSMARAATARLEAAIDVGQWPVEGNRSAATLGLDRSGSFA